MTTTYTESQTRANREKFLAALRSGEYKQGKNQLRDGGRFCCLGVACDVSRLGEWYDDSYLGHVDVLPPRVQEWLGVRDRNPDLPTGDRPPYATRRPAATLNDDLGWTFEEIADAFAQEWGLSWVNTEPTDSEVER